MTLIRGVTWIRYPKRKRKKRLAKKLAAQGGMRVKHIWIDTSKIDRTKVGRYWGVTFYGT